MYRSASICVLFSNNIVIPISEIDYEFTMIGFGISLELDLGLDLGLLGLDLRLDLKLDL